MLSGDIFLLIQLAKLHHGVKHLVSFWLPIFQKCPLIWIHGKKDGPGRGACPSPVQFLGGRTPWSRAPPHLPQTQFPLKGNTGQKGSAVMSNICPDRAAQHGGLEVQHPFPAVWVDPEILSGFPGFDDVIFLIISSNITLTVCATLVIVAPLKQNFLLIQDML